MAAPQRHVLVVFLKFPEPGAVKTRLAADVGPHRATELYKCLVAETLRHVPWEMLEVWLCYAPPDRNSGVQAWLSPMVPPGAVIKYLAQASGDLGDRMRAVMEQAFALPDTATLTFVGTDCPEMRWPVFVITQRMARENIDVVFGASLDGGYYLLALRKPCPELFINIPWSTENTLAVSLAAAERAGRKVHLLERRLRDIDTADDLRHWKGHEHEF